MRRSFNDVSNSLELLLDTICNTFGGILFLAILVAVLLRMSHRLETQSPDEPSETAETIAQRVELASILGEINSLRVARSEQESLAEQLANPEVVPLRRQLRQSQADVTGQQIQRITLREEIARFQARLASNSEEAKQLAEQTTSVEHEIASVNADLANVVQHRTRSTAIPRMRTSFKNEVPYVIRYGRLYANYNYNAIQSTRTLNTADFAVLGEKDGFLRTTPKPYAGLEIEDSVAFRAAWRKQLAVFDHRRHFITLVIWNDSFDEFAIVKEVLVQAGFEYRLVLGEDGTVVREGYVPNPQVQ